MIKESRTHVDFSKHVLTVKESDVTSTIVYEFMIPGTRMNGLTFINSQGIMAVTGDWGNWIFCREFHPVAGSDNVSGGYWDEKLQISSEQKSHKFDSEETTARIDTFKETFEESYGREMNEEELEWVEYLERNVDDEHEYVYGAYRQTPKDIDVENVPFGTKRHYWLNVVYDAFDYIVDMENEKLKVK